MDIRNFCIIAHIDHGKSTLADRMIDCTQTVSQREMKDQILDGMDLERERGITIKLQPVRMNWKDTQLNLIDTPGHVDFQFEVSRSLAACEGAILVVDATQGIQAQTLANLYMAMEQDLTIIPALNKIDLPAADPARVASEITATLGIEQEDMYMISGKTGDGVPELLDAILEKVPSPRALPGGAPKEALKTPEGGARALVFDSVFDPYRGVVAYVRVYGGEIKKRSKATFLGTGKGIEVLECGSFSPALTPRESLKDGEVGYIVTGLKTTRDARVGDTLYIGPQDAQVEGLPGFRIVEPMLYAGIYPTDAADYPDLRDALEKLSLSDAALAYEPEHNPALGNGFRIGLLGMLHMEIVQERLEREHDLDLLFTAPSVPFLVNMKSGEQVRINTAAELPDPAHIDSIEEPWSKVEIICREEDVGTVMTMCTKRRGKMRNMIHLEGGRVQMTFELPLLAVITELHDAMKSATAGYASMSPEFMEYRQEDLVKLDILIHGQPVESLSTMIHRSEARDAGAPILEKLKEVIPKHNFSIALQAAIGSRVLARETIGALRKDVTGHLYGGDVTRKNKLLKKQKAGKKRMKAMGKVELPQDAFLSILKRHD